MMRLTPSIQILNPLSYLSSDCGNSASAAVAGIGGFRAESSSRSRFLVFDDGFLTGLLSTVFSSFDCLFLFFLVLLFRFSSDDDEVRNDDDEDDDDGERPLITFLFCSPFSSSDSVLESNKFSSLASRLSWDILVLS